LLHILVVLLIIGVLSVLAIGPVVLAGLLLEVFAEVLTRIVVIELDIVSAR
jgi:hypothetical protein